MTVSEKTSAAAQYLFWLIKYTSERDSKRGNVLYNWKASINTNTVCNAFSRNYLQQGVFYMGSSSWSWIRLQYLDWNQAHIYKISYLKIQYDIELAKASKFD